MEPTFYQFNRPNNGLPYLVTVRDVDGLTMSLTPHLVTAEIPFKARPDGLPDSGELSKALRIEDSIIAKLGSDFIYLGHITHSGNVKVVFHSSKAAPSNLVIKTGLLQKVTIELATRLDPQWLWFDANMAASPIEKEIGRNQALIQTLAQHGDVSSKERDIDFTSYFDTRDQAQTFADAVTANGFTLGKSGIYETDSPDQPFTVSLVKFGKAEPLALAQDCAFLRAQTEAQQGVFDGWGCGIVK